VPAPSFLRDKQPSWLYSYQIRWRLSDEPVKEDEDDDLKDPEVRKTIKCTIFLGYTSNMISCGMREVIKFLCQHRMVFHRGVAATLRWLLCDDLRRRWIAS
jgi:hypothetical protein